MELNVECKMMRHIFSFFVSIIERRHILTFNHAMVYPLLRKKRGSIFPIKMFKEFLKVQALKEAQVGAWKSTQPFSVFTSKGIFCEMVMIDIIRWFNMENRWSEKLLYFHFGDDKNIWQGGKPWRYSGHIVMIFKTTNNEISNNIIQPSKTCKWHNEPSPLGSVLKACAHLIEVKWGGEWNYENIWPKVHKMHICRIWN